MSTPAASERGSARNAPKPCPQAAEPLSRFAALAARLSPQSSNNPQSRNALPSSPAAAVALLLAPDPDSLLLIQRAEREADRWSGHLAFPGGRSQPEDPDLAATARRETQEEVGITLESVPLLGALSDLEPRTPVVPRLVVRPFVYGLSERTPFRLNAEVAHAWWVPLEDFFRPGVHRPIEYHRYGTLVRASGYQLELGLLWGMSERILTELLGLLRPTSS